MYSSRKYPYSPKGGIGISWGAGGRSIRQKKNKEMYELMELINWNFKRVGEVLEKIPSVGEVWIFSETTYNY